MADTSDPPPNAPAAQPEPTHDPWVAEAERRSQAAGFRRPSFGPASRGSIYFLGLLAALRAAGLVLVAEGVARGIAALAAEGLTSDTARLIVLFGLAGALLRAGAEWTTTVVARRIATRVKADLRASLWHRLVAGGTARGSTAVLASDGLDDLDDYFQQSLPATIAAAAVPLLITARILGADWLSSLVIVLTLPLIPFFMVLIGKHTQQRTDEALHALERLADHLTELARGLPVLVGLGRVERQAQALDGLQTTYRRRTQETLRWAFLSSLALELTATISVAIIAVFLGLRLLNGTMELDAALLALILAPEAFNALRQVGTAFHASQDGLAALERSQELIDSEPPGDIRRAADTGARVSIRGLTVRYAGRHEHALQPITAELAGIVSVSGPSGAGKSTLLAALTGTLPADAEVTGTIEGVQPGDVGWGPQAPQSFAASPRAELELFGADPLEALSELGLAHRADAAVPELSPGELRRLAVARALARVDAGARLLVLDEPTAHLDRSSAELVRAAIRRRAARALVVLASHGPETTALATQTLNVRGQPMAASAAPSDSPGADAAAPTAPNPSAGLARGPRLRLRSLLGPHALIWAASTLLAAIAVSMGLALTAVSGWLIVRAAIEEHIMVLMVAIVGVRAFGIFRSAGRYADRLVTHEAAFRVIDDLRLRLWRAIADRGAGSRRLLEGGAPLDYLVTLADDLRDQLPRVLPPIGTGVAVVIGTATVTAFVAPQLTVIVTATLIGATALGTLLAITTERDAAAARIAARSEIVRGTAALSASASDLRGNGVADLALADLGSASARLAEAERRAAWSAGLGTAVITVALTTLAALVPVLAPELSAEGASVIALLSLALLEPLTDLVAAAHRVPALRRILARLGPVLQPAAQPTWGEATPESPLSAVELDDVAVRYPGAAHPAVAGVSGVAEAGSWLVLAGPSGSGKSTLLSAIMGALPLAHGAIRAGGRPLTDLREHAWKSRVAWCPQDAYVFDSTLRGNLQLAREPADAAGEAELHEALAKAGLAPLLSNLADGLDTPVGAGGSALSGGERQRLAVARALLTRAEVILLDEPTAHLDAPMAATMMADVRTASADRIVVLVSHRSADREPGDTVVQLAAG